MAIMTAPILSFNARGQIGKAVVFSGWKGIKTARQYAKPGNPNTTAQQATRGTFTFVHDAFKWLDARVQAMWLQYAQGKPLTGPTAWAQANIGPLIGKTDLADIIFSKSVNGGFPATGITIVAGANQLTITSPTPTVPAGWTVDAMIGVVMLSMAPTGQQEVKISFSGEDDTSPYSVVITGLTTSALYECGVFWRYTAANGKPAYGGSFNGTGTPT